MKNTDKQLNVVRLPQEIVEWAKRAYIHSSATDPENFLLNILQREAKIDFTLTALIPHFPTNLAPEKMLEEPMVCYRMTMLLERIDKVPELVTIQPLKHGAS